MYTVYALIDMHDETHRRLQVPDEAACEFGETVVCSGFDVTHGKLLHFLQSLIPLTGENLDQWTWEECRDYLHWCLDEGVLSIQKGRLVPVEDLIQAAPLTHDTDGETPESAEDPGLLRTVERTKPVIETKPAISTKEEADDLRLNRVVYASTPNMSMNAHKSAQEGADECSHDPQPDGAGTIG